MVGDFFCLKVVELLFGFDTVIFFGILINRF